MKIIVLTVDHLYANVIVKALLHEFKSDVKKVVISGVILHKTSFVSSLRRYFQTSGWYYFLVQAVKLEIYKLLSKLSSDPRNKFFSFRKNLNRDSLMHIADVNSKEFIQLVKRQRPDLIVSIFFNQILSPQLIKTANKGVINIHPAYLPNYKGVSPVFWTLVNEEKFAGVSIHYINNGIDTGGIIARKKVLIGKNDGEDSLYFRLATEGISILIKAINDIANGSPETINNSQGTYYSLPTKEAVKKFKKKGRNFFKLKEYIFK